MVTALQTLFRRGRKPTKLRTDKGVEFRNRDVQRLLKAEKVDFFYTQNEQKSSYAERCIKTLKSRLYRYLSRHQTHRWIDVLDEITQSYNAAYHRSIKMAPRAVTKKDETRLWKLQYSTQHYVKPATRGYKFRKGDTVRISHVRQPFDREYDERWTMEYFVVDDRGTKDGISYFTLKDTLGDGVQGTFYQSELNRVRVTEQTMYRIEKVIRRRRHDALVKWMGWPVKFNSWIPLSSLKDYKSEEKERSDDLSRDDSSSVATPVSQSSHRSVYPLGRTMIFIRVNSRRGGDDMMEDFYLHLFSGDSLSTHADNHAGDFVVDLPKRFLLEGTWECALTELALPSQPESPNPSTLRLCRRGRGILRTEQFLAALAIHRTARGRNFGVYQTLLRQITSNRLESGANLYKRRPVTGMSI
ncbi:Hypothetical predicted protein [Mytilus galloprovincialis]|nr:Hypothetical predicted protein [Mytilus galloprovincialis]